MDPVNVAHCAAKSGNDEHFQQEMEEPEERDNTHSDNLRLNSGLLWAALVSTSLGPP